jgi:hypothetical protein
MFPEQELAGGELHTTVAHGSDWTQLPPPSQKAPGPHAVLFGAKVMPHVPATHVRVAHTESVPGQSVGVTHETHCPAPLQTLPPPLEHAVPAAAGTHPGTPLAHVPVEQTPHVVGTFVLSGPKPQTPLVHTACWQDPAAACGHVAADVHGVPPPHPFAQICSRRVMRSRRSSQEQAVRQTPF